ncbi:MAG: hypothetical protein AAF202_12060 [Pseudomonadota bacterium]
MLPVAYHSVYLVFSVVFTIAVGQNLYRNGYRFLLDAFDNDAEMAGSINRLLLTGFYLVNFGLVSLFVSIGEVPTDAGEVFQAMTFKLGWVLLVLGGMHFFNMKNVAKIRSKAKAKMAHAQPVI